jgi:peptidyl-prolyl cis-trans isomerase D
VISSMREYFKSLKFILVIIILAFIGTSVVYFGTSMLSGGAGRPNVVATVNGEEIPIERFRRAQANLVESYERTAKQRMTPELAERLGLNQQVISELVTDAVIVQGAEREGVQVSDDELRARIQEMREFRDDGRFSRDRYLLVLRQARLDPGEFESEMRRLLVRRKMEALVRDGVKVSDGELREAYALRNERVRAAWASLEVQPLMVNVTVADSELEPYVKAHQAQFTRPERRRLQYVVFDPRNFPQPVSDQDVEAYYQSHGSEFEQPRRVHVAHVLVRVPPVGGSEAENKAKAKVEAVIKRAQAGEDFAKLAKEVSEDTSNAAQGGDLGLVGPGELVPQFEQAAFALKKGEVSPAPVRTPFGYHAIKILDVKEGGKAAFKEVAAKIRDKLSTERSDSAARAKADAARASLLGAKDFAAEAKTLGLEPQETTIARGEALEGIGRDAELEEAVFGLALGGVSSPVKTSRGYAVVKAVEQMPAGVPPLPDIKSRVIEAIKRERAEAVAMERAKALVASLQKGGDFQAAAKAAGFSTGEIPFFSRAEPSKERAALPGSVLLAALQTPGGQPADPVRAGATVYVVKTLERQPPDPQGFDRQRAELEKQTIEQKRSQIWESWVRARRAATKVEVAAGQAAPGTGSRY